MKDVVVTEGLPTTVGLEDPRGLACRRTTPPSRSRIKDAGIVMLGKTNMDEFAMGSLDRELGATARRTTRGTSAGSPAARRAGRRPRSPAFEAPLAIGTDTGGSIRQPAAVTGIVGHKPTYGGVSRYGLIAFSSSLDQAGPFARTVLDTALLHEVHRRARPVRLHLDRRARSAPVVAAARAGRDRRPDGRARRRRARAAAGEGYQPGVLASLRGGGRDAARARAPRSSRSAARTSSTRWPAYYLIAPSECSSNLARFDAVRYGLRVGDDGVALARGRHVADPRGRASGAEVKRRIMIGTYALSSGYYDAYYGQAQKVRTLIARDFAAAFEQADVLVSPTSPFVAFGIGERIADPMAMYVNDLCTLPASLAGTPAISVPCGLSEGCRSGCRSWPRRWPTTAATAWPRGLRGGRPSARRHRRRCAA